MQTDFPAVSARKVSEPVPVEADAAVATVWLALYLLMLTAAVAKPAISGALQLAGLD